MDSGGRLVRTTSSTEPDPIWVTGNYWAGGGHQFQLEHPLIMLIALAVAHIAAARARRASSAFRAARIRAIGVIVSLALILVGIPWTR